MNYTPLSTEDSIDSDAEHNGLEQDGLLYSRKKKNEYTTQSRWRLTVKALALLNACSATLFIVLAILSWRNENCVPGAPPPWSPLREDGVLRHVNTMYKPQKIFQSETSEEVEAAWEGWLDEYDHLLILPKARTESRLPVTVDAFLDPGYGVYGLAVYHQMHCLNLIRKAFHADKLFPNLTQVQVQFHKNHCFDMLRQSILCHADISTMYWWDDSYSYIDDAGAFHLTDHYFELTPSQRAVESINKWETPVQCRDLNAIHAWAKEHRMDEDKYAATVGMAKRGLN
ncbi:protein of unknown function (DUF3328) domain containing protein [Elaphomyces granulatus]